MKKPIKDKVFVFLQGYSHNGGVSVYLTPEEIFPIEDERADSKRRTYSISRNAAGKFHPGVVR